MQEQIARALKQKRVWVDVFIGSDAIDGWIEDILRSTTSS